MFKKSTLFVSLTLALTLTACDTDEIVDNLADDITDAATEAATNAATDTANDALNIGYLTGFYDTSTDDDETYVYFNDQGEITVYDYQGDTEAGDDSQDCYTYATEQGSTGQINSSLHGNEVTYDSKLSQYSIDIEGNPLTFAYNVVDGMHTFSYLSLSGATGLTYSNSDINISLGGDGNVKDTNLSVDDIEDNICSSE